MSNNYFNFKIPDFNEKFGDDWDNFKTIIDSEVDTLISKIMRLYWMMDPSKMPIRAVELAMQLRDITINDDDSLTVKRGKVRDYNSRYTNKGLAEPYEQLVEDVTGETPIFTLGITINGWIIGSGILPVKLGDGDIPDKYLIFIEVHPSDLGETWTNISTDVNFYFKVAYGNKIFIKGTVQYLYRSTDLGLTWTQIDPGEVLNQYTGIAHGDYGADDGTWVAVSLSGANRCVRSVDGGLTWFTASMPEANSYVSVAFGNNIFVAVSFDGTNRVARTTDGGITWNAVAAAEANQWYHVKYGNGVFIATSIDGTNRTMRSTDYGASWNAVAAPEANQWSGLDYGEGVWICVAQDGATYRIMKSVDDGVSWQGVTFAGALSYTWYDVCYCGNSTWVAVALDAGQKSMRSTDNGVTWELVDCIEGEWLSVASDKSSAVVSVAMRLVSGQWTMRSTSDSELDQIVTLLQEKVNMPAFYKCYLVNEDKYVIRDIVPV